MVSPSRWKRLWVISRSWWWTGRPGVLQFTGSQKVGQDWVPELSELTWAINNDDRYKNKISSSWKCKKIFHLMKNAVHWDSPKIKMLFLLRLPYYGSEGKASACSVGDWGLIPGSGSSPGEGNCNSLQYSCLENPIDRGAWKTTVHQVTKSWTRLSDFTLFFFNYDRFYLLHWGNMKTYSKVVLPS